MSRTLSYLALTLTLVGCHRSAPTPGDPAVPEPTTTTTAPPPARAYRVVPVIHGGTVHGRVVFAGDRPTLAPMAVPDNATPAICGATQLPPALDVGPDQGVRATVLSLDGITAGKPLDATPLTIDQHACQFTPHVVAGALDTPLRFTSSDPTILHVVRAYRGYLTGDGWFTRATPHGVSFSTTLDREGVGTFYCDSGHTWMLGFAHTFAHPYFAVSDTTGSFTMDQVPPGTYTLTAWHEGVGPATPQNGRMGFGAALTGQTSVTVAPDATVSVTWVLTSTALRIQP